MSGSNNEITNSGGPASGAEPSMEEILASIRRILKDDQPGTSPEDAESEEEVLVLDSTMVVKPGTGGSGPADAPPAPVRSYEQPAEHIAETPVLEAGMVAPGFEEGLQSTPHYSSESPDAGADLPLSGTNEDEAASTYHQAEAPDAYNAMEQQNMSDQPQENFQPPDGLVSDAASDAAAGSIGALIRSISSDRQIAIGRANLTLEDLVREELRPLLKAWLDTNLPALVERIVRAEIQRVIERSTT